MEKLPTTVSECHEVIGMLLAMIEELKSQFAKLEKENRDLKEQLNINSSNSSLPPSRDMKKKKNINRISSGKASGGQKGHTGHYRVLVPTEAVDKVEYCRLPKHCICGGLLKSKEASFRHQVHELPILKLEITEYQLEKGYCCDCHREQTASLPEGVSWGITGSRLTSLMSELVSKYGLSRRELQEFLSEHYRFDISLGTVFNKQKVVNKALKEPVEGLLPEIKSSVSIHSDETGHNRDGKRHWLWGFIGGKQAYFTVEASRGKKVLQRVLGDVKSIIISDRYSAYHQFSSEQRQVCWAHLKRDFRRLSEKSDKVIRRIGEGLLEKTSLLFSLWHEFKDGSINREMLNARAQVLRREIGELLEQGSYTDPSLKASRFCKNLLEHFDALWTFLEIEGVEPTNNTAERALRHSVIWRKKYFCTRSDYGSEYVARTASINTTCRLQNKSSFEYLSQIIRGHFSNQYNPANLALSS